MPLLSTDQQVDGAPQPHTTGTKIIRRDRLGGVIHEYMQVA